MTTFYKGVGDPYYVAYTVQKGDTLWDLWQKSHMTRKEWKRVNGNRDTDALLHPGEKIILNDPIEACYWSASAYKEHFFRMTFVDVLGSDSRFCDFVFGSFKPLAAYTKSLERWGFCGSLDGFDL